jgi:hypothetical protein
MFFPSLGFELLCSLQALKEPRNLVRGTFPEMEATLRVSAADAISVVLLLCCRSFPADAAAATAAGFGLHGPVQAKSKISCGCSTYEHEKSGLHESLPKRSLERYINQN